MSVNQDVFPVYIGYDEREHDAFTVCQHSLKRHASVPTYIMPLKQESLKAIGLYNRPYTIKDGVKYDIKDGKPFSTDFSFTRFLVPALTQYNGWALFCDCDMLIKGDVAELMSVADERYAAMVVKHAYNPNETVKMDGQVQDQYYRKNWSSFILWNCNHFKNAFLTPDCVNTETGGYLHAFAWLEDEEIGELDEAWNWLEGWSSSTVEPKNVHYTRGGPWFDAYKNVQYADDWLNELRLANHKLTPSKMVALQGG